MATYGKVQWGSNNRGGPNRDNVMTLVDGQNKLRVVTAPFRFFVHKKLFDNDKSNYARTIRCATENCPLCAESSAKEKYVVGVINRKDGTYKLLEIGTAIYNSLNTFRAIPGYEDLTTFDVIIVRNPKGGATGFYQVIPGAPTPLTAADIALFEAIKEEELEAFCNPPSAEEVTQSCERIAKWIEKQNMPADGQQQQGQQHAPQQQAKAALAPKAKAAPAVAQLPVAEVTDADLDFNEIKK